MSTRKEAEARVPVVLTLPADDLSFVVRLWRTAGETGSEWQGSVLCTDNGERIGFADVAGLCAYLLAQIESNDDEAAERP